MRSFLLTLILPSFLLASQTTQEAYFDLISRYPSLVEPRGDHAQGEIEIIVDAERMAAIEKKMKRDVGVVAQDRYWIWVNDACVFPSGAEGVYGRILWRNSLDFTAGVAVMPILPDGRVVLNCNFRHATRSWEIELPRGGCNRGEKIEDAAKREVIEETGMSIDSLSFLGTMPPDSGLTTSEVPIFTAAVLNTGEATPEESEAIEEILALSIEEIKQAFVLGYYTRTIRGVETKVLVRDPFLAYAILIHETKGMKK